MTPHSTSSALSGDDDLDVVLLERYWAGETSPEETAAVQAWFAAHPEWHVWYEQLRGELKVRPWADLSSDQVNRFVTDALQTMGIHPQHDVPRGRGVDEADMYMAGRAEHPSSSRPSELSRGERSARFPGQQISWPRAATRRGLLAIGLAVMVAAGVGVLVQHKTEKAPDSVTSYATANGERATISLPDGSTIILDVGSRLEIPTNFGQGEHTVRLEGQAFFKVVHHKATPFVVVAGPSTTRVLGTRFTVRHYPGDSAATVAVQDGKVAVGTAVLTAQQQVSVSRHAISEIRPTVAGQFTFADGVLTLPEMSLAEAIPHLNRWYGADIRLGDQAVGSQRIEGRFITGAIADLADNLQWTFNLRVLRNGRVLTLYSR